MTEAQRTVVDGYDRAQDVEAGTGAQFLCEGRVEARWASLDDGHQRFALADKLEKIPCRIGKPLEIVGDGEMLHDIAFPCTDDATIGLDPLRHAASSIDPALAQPLITTASHACRRNATARLIQMACHAVARRYLPQRRLRAGAMRHGEGAARMKPATTRRTERGRDLTRQDDLLFQLLWTGEQDRGKEG